MQPPRAVIKCKLDHVSIHPQLSRPGREAGDLNAAYRLAHIIPAAVLPK